MKIVPNLPDEIVNNSQEAQKIFFENTQKSVSFKPYIVNFHNNDDDFISSICWKGCNKVDNKEAIVSAISIPQSVLRNFKKTKYIPLKKGDTLMLNGKIFTIEEKGSLTFIMELPYICSGKYAESIVNIANGIKNLFWRLALGLSSSEPVCPVWLGVNVNDVEKSMMLPVFAKDKANLNLINDLDIIDINSTIIINNGIYYYHHHDNGAQLEFLTPMIKGPIC